ncbi:MAG: hypothetical protein WED34_07195 [Planctomycetales bacterium]
MIEVVCPHCGTACDVPKSMAGGRTNCAHCGNLVEIPGVDHLFVALVCGGALGVLALSGVLYLVAGPWAGGIAMLVGMGIVGAVILAS